MKVTKRIGKESLLLIDVLISFIFNFINKFADD